MNDENYPHIPRQTDGEHPRERTAVDPGLKWASAGLPKAAYGRGLDDLPDVNPDALTSCREFVHTLRRRYLPQRAPMAAFPADRSLLGRGLTLTGPNRRGKTSLACAILTEVAARYPDVQILFCPWADYMHAFNERHVYTRLGAAGVEDYAGITRDIDAVLSAGVLVLDDVGHEHTTASRAAIDELDRIVRRRHRHALPTIMTTDLLMTGWSEAYTPALSAFLSRELPPVLVDSGRALGGER